MERSEANAVFSGHNGAIYDVAHWDAASLWVTAAGDGVVAAWADGGQGKALLHHKEAFFSVATWADWLFAGSASGEVLVAHRDGRLPQRVEAHGKGVFAMMAVAGTLWTGGGEGQILRWQFNDNRWTPDARFAVPDGSKIRTLVPDGGGFLVGTSGGWLGTFDPVSGFSRFAASAPTGHYSAVRIPGKRAWLLAEGDGHLRVHDETGGLVLSLSAHQGPIYRLVVTGDVIWSVSRDKTIKAWNARDLSPADRVAFKSGGHTRWVNALAAAPRASGGWDLVTGGDDRNARLFVLNDSGFRATNPLA